jgi:hypothetical protein
MVINFPKRKMMRSNRISNPQINQDNLQLNPIQIVQEMNSRNIPQESPIYQAAVQLEELSRLNTEELSSLVNQNNELITFLRDRVDSMSNTYNNNLDLINQMKISINNIIEKINLAQEQLSLYSWHLNLGLGIFTSIIIAGSFYLYRNWRTSYLLMNTIRSQNTQINNLVLSINPLIDSINRSNNIINEWNFRLDMTWSNIWKSIPWLIASSLGIILSKIRKMWR